MIQPNSHELAGHVPGRPPEAALRVVIVHDDLPSYRRALRLLVRVLGPEAGGPAVQPLPWRFSELGRRAWRERAWIDAEGADLFIVAPALGAGLPADMVDWLEISFERRRHQPAAVVWLESEDQVRDAGQENHRARLRRSAEAAGLNFLDRTEAGAVAPAGAR